MAAIFPKRIVCLTEETTETLYLLGEQDRLVGISGFTVRPPQARREKPRVSAFTSANIEKILALQPDLVLGFSDLQADIAADLIKHGLTVTVFNQRSVQEILNTILTLGAMVGAEERARSLTRSLQEKIDAARQRSKALAVRPKVYFEEWDDPQISGIRWVSQLVGIAGGEDIFPELARSPDAQGRIVRQAAEVVRRNPDIIIGSWCGKKFRPEKVCARPGWEAISAVKNGHVFEIKSALILQPGPAALTDGLDRLSEIILNVSANSTKS
ncbi:cobalamin-binding protein [candidate division KSB1 bacterium]|nr:cobalamin-binding protein [candidate division KSB1 bacterium]